MKNTAPHYLLITETKTIIDPREAGQATPRRSGQWRFVLEQMGVEARVEVADDELDVFGERLELLAVVRGLESLEQRSRVTLLTSSRYVSRGIRNGINQWRYDHWRWERFGKMTLIKNHDLWKRVDRTLQFHALECRLWNLGRLTNHAKAASSEQAESAVVPSSEIETRIETAHHKANVIRPHGDRSATTRKRIEPPPFASEIQTAVESKTATSRPWLNHSCGLRSLARVKPPRAGRAYGYAVN